LPSTEKKNEYKAIEKIFFDFFKLIEEIKTI